MRARISEELNAAVEHAKAARAPQVPLIEAAAAGRIALVIMADPTVGLPNNISLIRRPVVLVIGDDPNPHAGHATGPAGWKVARRLKYWRPQLALIHASGGQLIDYELALGMAEQTQRFLIVETSSLMARTWHDVVVPLCGCVMIVPAEGAHPVADIVH